MLVYKRSKIDILAERNKIKKQAASNVCQQVTTKKPNGDKMMKRKKSRSCGLDGNAKEKKITKKKQKKEAEEEDEKQK